MSYKLIDKSFFTEPYCINEGCGNKVHTREINKNGTRNIRTECYVCHRGGRNRPGVTPYKKKYCENKDGRLGFDCTYKILDECQLEMDHIDGDRWNNIQKNVQTICRNCHAIKTKLCGDSKNNKEKLTLDKLDVNNIATPLTLFMK